MRSNKQISDLCRRTSELLQESAQLKMRLRQTLYETTEAVQQSRALLAYWPAAQTRFLHQPERRQAQAMPPEPAPQEQPRSFPTQENGALERVVEQDFSGELVRLDGRHFVDCRIENCALEYHGGPVVLESTHFTGCRFRFGGEAAMTISVLECFDLIGKQGVDATRLPPHPGGTTRVN